MSPNNKSLHLLIIKLPLPMKLTNRMNELLNSGITLTAKETEQVEAFIQSKSKPVKPQHLNHYKCLSSIRSIAA